MSRYDKNYNLPEKNGKRSVKWDSSVIGWAGFKVLVRNLQVVKQNLKVWNSQEFGNINFTLDELVN